MMKCQHCGKNEATFYYRSVVNGEATEMHLCAGCAAELGYQTGLCVDLGSGFDDLFSLLPRVVGAEEFFDLPRFTRAAHRTLRVPSESAEEHLLSPAEETALRREREKNALHAELEEALAAEDYERAAKVRDRIKEWERKESDHNE